MDYLSNVEYCFLPNYRMTKKQIVSANPEEDIISQVEAWAKENGVGEHRSFGFDVPVSKMEKEKGLRGYAYCISIPESLHLPDDYELFEFKGGHFGKIRVFYPFSDSFVKIPTGWQTLHFWLKERNLLTDSCEEGSCIEECLEGETVLDLYLQVKERF